MKEPKVCIVIVNYNGAKYQNDCIRTIKDSVYQNYEMVVVDNNSTDNSMVMLKREYPEVKTIELKDNRGVTGGNNVGIQYSIQTKAEYTLLMNNDVELDKNTISELVKSASENTVTVPKILYFDRNDMLWYGGGYLDWKWGTGIHQFYREIDRGQANTQRIVTYSPACCMLIHNSVFERIGMLDEAYFMYFDDTDFCARLEDAGLQLLYVPGSFLWHKVSSSTGGESSKLSVYYMSRNHLYYLSKFKKNVKMMVWIRVMSKGLAKYLRSFFIKKNYRIVLNGYKDYFRDNMYQRNI